MGAGKSFWANFLAKKLGFNFFDSDSIICKELASSSVAECFEKKGEMRFRAAEASFIRNYKFPQNSIIALGGGLPCFNNNMYIIKERGVSIYIKPSVETIYNNLIKDYMGKGCEYRPLFKKIAKDCNMDRGKIISSLEKHIRQREQFYLQADLIAELD